MLKHEMYSTEPMNRDFYVCHLCGKCFSPKNEGVFIRCARHKFGHRATGTKVLNDNILALCDDCVKQVNERRKKNDY